MRRSIRSIALVLAAAAFAAGCVSGDKLISSAAPTVNTLLLARYVSMGNSITAGMQSAGINDSTQRQAYPVLLARMAGVPFQIASLGAGCPAPFAVPLGPTRTANPPNGCALRQPFQGLANNVAVPGEYMADITNPLSPGAANPLSMFINGGLDEAQAMAAQSPTFVTFAAPNNDVLAAVNVGDTTAKTLTPLATYTAGLTAAVAAIKAVPTLKGAVLIGVIDVPDLAPIVQPGAFFFAAFTANPNQFGKPVDGSCSPFTATGQVNAFGFNLVSFQVASDTSVHVIKCTPDARWVTTTSVAGAAGGTPEYPVFIKRIADINAAVKAAADVNGWVYIDPNTALAGALADPNKVRKCQGLATATNLLTFQAAVQNTCPGPTAPNFFGSLISLDGTHPSFAFHQAFAAILAGAINQKYGTSISTTPPTSAVFAR